MSNPHTRKLPGPICAFPDYSHEEPWRVFRVMAELVESFEEMSKQGPLISIFGSARLKEDDPDYKDARELGKLLVKAGYGVLTGGGPGIMEAGNRGAYENDGISVGLNIKLPHEQHGNPYQTSSLNFHYFFLRKVCFLKYSVALAVYPGGFGTMDEFFEMLTMIQTQKVSPIPLVLVGKSFWTPLLEWFRKSLLGRNMIAEKDIDLVYVAKDAADASRYIQKRLKQGIGTTSLLQS